VKKWDNWEKNCILRLFEIWMVSWQQSNS